MVARSTRTPVYLEVGSRRVFACSVDWPGWCRSGKDEEQALAALADYAPRYEPVAARADAAAAFRTAATADFDIVERVQGNATTDFGAPGVVPKLDAAPLTAGTAERLAALVAAAWTLLDEVAAGAPAELRKGPRGGGRDRDQIVQHVVSAEASYARTIGVKHRAPELGDTAAIKALRADILSALRSARDGAATTRWPPPYAARRIAWHVLDHAWEIEDKSDGGDD